MMKPANPRPPAPPADDLAERLSCQWQEGPEPDARQFLLRAGPLTAEQTLVVLRADQHERWRRGRPLPAETYLQWCPALAGHPELALELVYGEFVLREDLGQAPDPADYLRRFPQYADRFRQQLELHRALALDSEDDSPSLELEQADTVPPGRPQASTGAGPAEGPPPLPAVAGYVILGELGRGGMGVVYKARQISLNRLVALKMILAGDHAGAKQLARFRREAEAVARLQHPNIVQIHEVGEQDGRPFFSLEFLEGGTLAGKLHGTPLPPPEAARLVETLARAVHAAHQRGIVHRDLKPHNILLTADGTPKVADFGLAKQTDGPAESTREGSILGTASYMAPEQARGIRDLGPPADVYSLGAILYETLTGRPPFTAATPLETLMQVAVDDPVPPTRLQPKVPRDLETVCLKCLRKDPGKRYASAEELADDLRRFRAGEPIRARPAGKLERAAKWVRRNKALAAFLATAGLLLVGGGVAGLWFQAVAAERAGERARTDRNVAVALKEATTLADRARTLTDQPHEWQITLAAARNAVRQADSLLKGTELADPALRERVRAVRFRLDADEDDRRLAARLDQIRMETTETDVTENRFKNSEAFPRLREAFADHGLPLGKAPVAKAVAWLKERSPPVRKHLVAGLDECLRYAPKEDAQVRRWLAEVLAGADGDPWREQVRSALERKDVPALKALVRKVSPAGQPPGFLARVAYGLPRDGQGSRLELLRHIQEAYPGDFWANLDLAFEFANAEPPRSEEAVRYYTAAIALRPDNPGVYIDLGAALFERGDVPGAVKAWRKAAALNPRYAMAYNNLGVALKKQRDLPGAIQAYRKAIELNPKLVRAHYNLGVALTARHDLDGALQAFRKVIELDPKNPSAYFQLGQALAARRDPAGAARAYRQAVELSRQCIARDPEDAWAYHALGMVLAEQHDLPGAVQAFRKAAELNPHFAWTFYDLGTTLYARQDFPGAVQAFRKAIALKPQFPEAYTNLGNALRDQKDLAGAVRAYRKALEVDPTFPEAFKTYGALGITLAAQGDGPGAVRAYRKSLALKLRADTYVNLGRALQSQKDLPGAVEAYHKALALNPKLPEAHFNLGAALMQQGEFTRALAALNEAARWLPPSDRRRGSLVNKIRECQRWIEREGQLPDVLAGKVQPTGAGEWVAFANVCMVKRRYAAAARLFQKAFTLDPRWADVPNPSVRYLAACCAARAGSGQGEDAPAPGNRERTDWRKQALAWLRADLARWGKRLAEQTPEARAAVRQKLREWQLDPDLAGIRDAAALAQLPPGERAACKKLWADVAALRDRAGPEPE